MSFVSVIIPCYNAAAYIGDCLKALQRQTFRDFDVVIVDDCSTDHTVDVIRAFSFENDFPINLLCNRENVGPGASRNNGINHSSAKYVCFCDSDDWYDPDYLEKMVEASQNGQADLVLCNSRKVSGKMVVDIPLFNNLPVSVDAKCVLALGVDSLCCMMVRREIAVAVPLPCLRNGEDMAVVPLLIMRCSKFGFVEECIYNYRCRPGSLSLSAQSKVIKSLEQSFEYMSTRQTPGFDLEVEFIGVKNLVYGGLLNHFKAQWDNKPAQLLLERYEKKYPQWYSNIYCRKLPIFKKMFLFFAKKRWFVFVKMMCCVHRLITERG